MPVDGIAAARTLQGFAPLAHHGACLFYVWRAYDAHGADTQRTARTALEAWNLTDDRRPGDRNPPPGVPVWFGRRTRDGDMAGDVVISLGDGRVVATDQPTWGKVGVTTIAGRQALIGREYLGWSECIFDVPIQLSLPARGGATPTPVPGIPIPPERNDDMARNSGVLWTEDNGKTTMYMVFNSDSGWEHTYTRGEGRGPMSSDYNDAFAKALDTPAWATITEAHAKVIRAANAATRKVSGTLQIATIS